MEAHLPHDYPPDHKAYEYFAVKFGRSKTAIAKRFFDMKRGINLGLSPEELAKNKIEREQQLYDSLEEHFITNIYPDDADIREIAEAHDQTFLQVKNMSDNFRLEFIKNIGEEKFQKRIDAGNYTAYPDDEE